MHQRQHPGLARGESNKRAWVRRLERSALANHDHSTLRRHCTDHVARDVTMPRHLGHIGHRGKCGKCLRRLHEVSKWKSFDHVVEPRRWSRNKRKTRKHEASFLIMPSIHASMLSNDSTCYLWFSKCLYLWFEIILEIIFYLKLLLYAENVLTLCRAFAESLVTFVTARSFSSPMQRRTTPWVFRVSTAHHIPAIPATRQPKASTDRWSDGPISSVSYHQLPHPDGLAFNQRSIVGGHHKDHGGIHGLDVLKYGLTLS